METSKRVLDRHLERSGVAGKAEDGPSFNLFATRYALREGLRVAIIIPTKNHGDLLKQCIDSIHKTVTQVPYHILVVDHESTERATLAYLSSIDGEAQVARYEGPFNFGAINNWAVKQLDGEYTHYLLCNNDIEAYEEGWLERMLELAQQRDVGMVGAKLFYPDRRTVQHGGVCVGMFGAAEHYGKRLKYPGDGVEHGFGELLLLTHEVAAVTAACVLVRKEAWDEVDGFDEAIAVGFGDVDLCLRVDQAGYRIVFCPHARLVHHESFTRGVSRTDPHPADSALYRMKWKDFMKAGDPYYSPNLSLTSTQWELRRPIPVNLEVRRRVSTLDREAGRTRVAVTAAQKG
jgi:GT2 family glycosyltransferase